MFPIPGKAVIFQINLIVCFKIQCCNIIENYTYVASQNHLSLCNIFEIGLAVKVRKKAGEFSPAFIAENLITTKN